MPSCRITNYTTQPLNVSLKHLCALHFENEVAPGQTIKLKPGRVWFTLEVLVDDEKNRYSVAQSAAAIAIVSLACVGTAALAVPAAAAASSAGVGSAIVAGASQVGTAIASGASTIATSVTTVGPSLASAGAGVWAVSDTIAAGFGTVYGAAQGFLSAHAATASKISAAFLPRAIEVVEKEVGGFNAVQKEVIAILSSPTVTEDVRNSGLSILSRLGAAVAADRAAEAEAKEKEKAKEKENEKLGTISTPSEHSKEASSSRPPFKHLSSSVSMLLHNITHEGREERKSSKAAAKEAKLARKDASSWEDVSIEEDIAAGKVLSASSAPEHKRVCVHGLFMNERRHFEVHEKEGKLVLVDANTGAVLVA